ncbi:MAG: NAD-dependent epimerase/dehydratase [Parcubacteria group bacterium Greene0714_36]|nr:MAG: NAD-dependent epimerase/dehydratase [Parcubacteria group bacterium Greene0714_36]
MKVLLTGHRGYIGAVLGDMLAARGHEVVGYDTGLYAGSELYPWRCTFREIRKDIRDISPEDVDGIEGVIHLAALSNDPLGELDARLTEEINFQATVRLAELARAAGVRRFVFASTQSIYGISRTDEELDEETSEKNPITAYAKTKWRAERALKPMGTDTFAVVFLRPATVFGASPMLRCDIVFNNFVACAYTGGTIEIKSDGTPWRPVVHVRDVSAAFIAALDAPKELVAGEAFNVGIPNGNFSVRDLAEAAQRAVPGSKLIFTGEHGSDARSYRVSFKKILSVLKEGYQPQWDLDRGAAELIELFGKCSFTADHFRGRATNRLPQIRYLLETKKIDNNLRWR